MRDTRTFAQAIRKAGATPALYMVWPSRGRHRDFPDVVESYRSAARAVDGILLPVGQAWRNLEKADPAMALYSSDDLHPTLRGSYLAAVVIASRLYGLSPRSLAKEIPLAAAGSREIPPEDVRRLQDAAAEAVAGLPPVRLAHSPR